MDDRNLTRMISEIIKKEILDLTAIQLDQNPQYFLWPYYIPGTWRKDKVNDT